MLPKANQRVTSMSFGLGDMAQRVRALINLVLGPLDKPDFGGFDLVPFSVPSNTFP